MYVPAAFRQTDLATIHDFVSGHPFGILVCGGGELVANHLPFLLLPDEGPRGALVGHVAAANDLGKAATGQEVLAIFPGPHAYISPAWYAAEGVVPTWNYQAVHARGRLEVVIDDDFKIDVLQRSVAKFESFRESPWTFSPDDPHMRRLLPAIVAFRIDVVDWQAKWKLGQNQPDERRQRAAASLANVPSENARTVAAAMLAIPSKEFP